MTYFNSKKSPPIIWLMRIINRLIMDARYKINSIYYKLRNKYKYKDKYKDKNSKHNYKNNNNHNNNNRMVLRDGE